MSARLLHKGPSSLVALLPQLQAFVYVAPQWSPRWGPICDRLLASDQPRCYGGVLAGGVGIAAGVQEGSPMSGWTLGSVNADSQGEDQR